MARRGLRNRRDGIIPLDANGMNCRSEFRHFRSVRPMIR